MSPKSKHNGNLLQVFKDKDGNIVIAQFPNKPLILAGLFYLLTRFSPPPISIFSIWGFRFTLFYWAYLEIIDGANTWRRFLGLVVILWQIWHIFFI